MGYLLRLGVCLLAIAPLGASNGSTPTFTDPYAIFNRVRAYWDTALYPSTASYGIVVTVARRGTVSTAHYHAFYDTAANKVVLDAVSDEELAHPYVPKGISTQINLSLYGVPLKSIPLSAPQRTFDYLGVPLLTPDYSFGLATIAPHATNRDSADLVRQIRAEFNDPAPPRKMLPTKSGLKTIAAVYVSQRHYIITLAGITSINGHSDYDLRLKPVSNPSIYRLREVWANAQTFATDQLVTEGNFSADDLRAVRWIVKFDQIDGAPYIRSEVAQSGFVLDRRAYDSAEIAFTDISAKPIPWYTALSAFQTQPGSAPEVLQEPPPPESHV